MELEDLIEEYKTLPQFCDNIDYESKEAVKKNNASVSRMYKIVETIRDKFGAEGVNKLTELLDVEDHHTNLWIATHLLEKVAVDKITEEKALEIIRRVSATDEHLELGYSQWLNDYEKRRGS